MKSFFEKLFSIPKSLYVSLRLFPLAQAMKMPVLCRYNVKCLSLRGHVDIPVGGVKTGMIHIGFGRVGIFDKKYSRSILEINGTLHAEGNGTYNFGQGCRLCVMKDGHLYVGTGFSNTAEGTIICQQEVRIGRSVTMSWNTMVTDTDFHEVQNTLTHEVYPATRPVVIGNKVWLCTRSVVLKGSRIPDCCIVGANATVNKSFTTVHALIAGNPAKVMKTDVTMYRPS